MVTLDSVRLASRLPAAGSEALLSVAAIFGWWAHPGADIRGVYLFGAPIESFSTSRWGRLDSGLRLRSTWISCQRSCQQDPGRRFAPGRTPDASAGLTLERIRDQLAANDVILWSGSGQLIASAGATRFQLNPERPTPQQLRNTRQQRSVAIVEGLDEPALATVSNARVKAMAVVTSSGVGLLAEPRFLQVTQSLPPTLVANAIAVQEANREYQERALGRQGLRRMYIVTLSSACSADFGPGVCWPSCGQPAGQAAVLGGR